ncbi:alpha/beta hydrolase fold-containing protein [Schizosaccharomyces cryophilus OY26]|uniref:Alpha/beta hydrolase fold-containing protein n=1 Tax=Schizosaccharomyces cryophilus (strain OY26 / ATCC MYA-4695 / CBS 11777 / NBRC 106824 / NRRL Y48691) TaxID=653667 RepID=S9VVK7_SCHCR|nr:alpha/beta hydrolase fold-containing protein [Schizosaccharomyces cryophilus OY26]EPY50145.1 alpha/beta hydrolase fold-containing protein [Schizosaccharomyces cryophilus OY26]
MSGASEIFTSKNLPSKVERSEKNPELAEWMSRNGPVLGTHDETVATQRRNHDVFITKNPYKIGKIEHLALNGPYGTIPVRVYHASKPGPAHGAALIYLHGGGFQVGSIDQFDNAMRIFSEVSGCQVYIVDYRLSPEYQWPTQITEGEFVVRWIFENAKKIGVDENRIALGGDSAGGNMTCTITQKLRDEGGPKLALQIPIYPETKMAFDTKAAVENRVGNYVETAGLFQFLWNLLPPSVDYSQPYVTPLNAKDFSNLPRALFVNDGFDMLRDVGHEYARKLAAAGNDLVYIYNADLTHGFIQMAPFSKRCLEATEEIAYYIGELLKAS